MKAKDLDKIFDDGEVDINDCLDLSKAFRPGQEQKRVNVDFPVWMIDRLDREAEEIGDVGPRHRQHDVGCVFTTAS